MPGLNRVQLIGRLGKDPETRFTPTGKKVATFSLAVDRRWKGSDGTVKQDTDWFNVEAWGSLGETCQKILRKGQLIFLEGRLKTDRYEEKGETRYFTRVIARNMQVLEWPEKKEAVEEAEAVIPPEEEPPLEEE
jgi:single-strand DNA-binding protein